MNAKAVVESWLDAIEAQDTERMLEALADDVELRYESMDRPILGKEVLRGLLSSIAGTYDFIRMERQKVLESGNEVAALVRVRAKMQTDAEILGERLPTAGKEVSIIEALFLTVNEAGKITQVTRVRDNLEVSRQLGIPADRMQSLLEKFEQYLAA
jgi:steroid delta-isomerase-like uncharacterized protein